MERKDIGMMTVGVGNISNFELEKRQRPLNLRIKEVDQISPGIIRLVFSYDGFAPKDARWSLYSLNGQTKPVAIPINCVNVSRGVHEIAAKGHCKMWIMVHYKSGMVCARSKSVDVVVESTKLSARLKTALKRSWILLKYAFWYTKEL